MMTLAFVLGGPVAVVGVAFLAKLALLAFGKWISG